VPPKVIRPEFIERFIDVLLKVLDRSQIRMNGCCGGRVPPATLFFILQKTKMLRSASAPAASFKSGSRYFDAFCPVLTSGIYDAVSARRVAGMYRRFSLINPTVGLLAPTVSCRN
jgi:hypothetical protein